jgi:hypothetical protein
MKAGKKRTLSKQANSVDWKYEANLHGGKK